MLDEKLVVIGKNSYIGARFVRLAEGRGADLIALGSADCDFTKADQVHAFFDSHAGFPLTLVMAATINKYVANSFQSYLDNVTIIQNLLASCARTNVRSMIYLSSCDVYGRRPPVPVTESSPIAPDSWYALAKYTCEWILLSSGSCRFPVTVLRLPGIYGPAANDRSVIGRLVNAATTGRVVINGRGSARRDYVFLDDLVRLIDECIRLRHHGVLNIGTGRSQSILEYVQVIQEALGRTVEVSHVEAHAVRDFDLSIDPELLRTWLPDFQFTSLAESIQRYL